MRILFISDVHERCDLIATLPSADLLLVGGDIAYSELMWAMFRFAVADYMTKTKTPQCCYVLGNHDVYTPESLLPRGSLECIMNHHVQYQGFDIAGLGYSWETEEFLLSSLQAIGKADILLSHAPPFNTQSDYSDYGGFNPTFPTQVNHLGSVAIKNYLIKQKPRLMCVGHIHEGKGVERIEQTVVVNAGTLEKGYALININKSIKVELVNRS